MNDLQKIELELFKVFKEICEKLNSLSVALFSELQDMGDLFHGMTIWT